MAKFLKGLIEKKNNMGKAEKKSKDEGDAVAGVTPPQEENKYAGLTKVQAKADLEKRIAEKLSSMPESDLTELLRIQEERERQRKAIETHIDERREKRQGKKREFVEPIVTKDAVLANFHTMELPVLPIEAKPLEPERMEGQIGILELNDIAKKEREKERERERRREQEEAKRAAAAAEECPPRSLKFQQSPDDIIDFNIPRKISDPVDGAAKLQDGEENSIPKIYKGRKHRRNFSGMDDIEKPLRKALAEYDMFTDKIYAVIGSFLKLISDKIKAVRYKIYEKRPELWVRKYRKNRRNLRKIITFKNNFVKREKETAARMIHFINRMDNRNDELADKTTAAVATGGRKFNFAREWADLNKRRLLSMFALVIMITLGGVAVFNHLTAYEYAYNNRVLGLVKNQEDVLRILDLVGGQLSREHNAQITIDPERDITFNRVLSINGDLDDMEDVLRRLTYMQDMNAKGYGLYVDGKRVAIVDNKATAQAILDEIIDTYLKVEEGTQYEDIGFAEAIEIKPIDTKLGNIMNTEKVRKKILTGAVEQKAHVVAAGETFSGIAKYYNMSQSDLMASNPAVTPERLSIGQEIILTHAVPLLTVQTVEVATYMEVIPFETAYENNASVYKGEQSTKVKGVNGQRQVVAKITRNNGIEVSKEELQATVLQPPTTALIMVGTKALPPLQGTGHLKAPVSGYKITSKFGGRWGRMHEGIDMACRTGTQIRSADGGTVTFAGYHGTYGYMVQINHGNNMTTVYAHCSKLYVSKGEKVYQGQHIANVGSTGRSTGPHLHFEVRVNGKVKNPLNYI